MRDAYETRSALGAARAPLREAYAATRDGDEGYWDDRTRNQSIRAQRSAYMRPMGDLPARLWSQLHSGSCWSLAGFFLVFFLGGGASEVDATCDASVGSFESTRGCLTRVSGQRPIRTFLIGIALGFESRELFLELEGVRPPVSIDIVLGCEWETGVKIEQVGYLEGSDLAWVSDAGLLTCGRLISGLVFQRCQSLYQRLDCMSGKTRRCIQWQSERRSQYRTGTFYASTLMGTR